MKPPTCRDAVHFDASGVPRRDGSEGIETPTPGLAFRFCSQLPCPDWDGSERIGNLGRGDQHVGHHEDRVRPDGMARRGLKLDLPANGDQAVAVGHVRPRADISQDASPAPAVPPCFARTTCIPPGPRIATNGARLRGRRVAPCRPAAQRRAAAMSAPRMFPDVSVVIFACAVTRASRSPARRRMFLSLVKMTHPRAATSGIHCSSAASWAKWSS